MVVVVSCVVFSLPIKQSIDIVDPFLEAAVAPVAFPCCKVWGTDHPPVDVIGIGIVETVLQNTTVHDVHASYKPHWAFFRGKFFFVQYFLGEDQHQKTLVLPRRKPRHRCLWRRGKSQAEDQGGTGKTIGGVV